MNKKTQLDDGGSAFPRDINSGSFIGYEGMSLRDWFAGQALPQIIRTYNYYGKNVVAKRAYEYADAMIAERNKQNKY